jgi:chromosome segregation ATPase
MLLQVGTVDEQWRDVGVEVFLGRLTAREVFDECGRLIAAVRERAAADLEERTARLEGRVVDAEALADVVRKEADDLEAEVEELKAELRDARREAAEDARTLRGLEDQVKALESARANPP